MSLLGTYSVMLRHKLSWNPDVEGIAKKANRTRAFLQRNLRGAPMLVRAQCYKTFVRPTLEYAAAAWAPHTRLNVQRLESVQRRAADLLLVIGVAPLV